MSPFAFFAALVVPVCAWSQPAGKPVPVESAYVEIVPAGSSDADDILAVERGVELVLCQAGIRRRVEGREAKAELKLVASLARAELEADGGRCEITNASATLPGGASVALPGMALVRPIRPGRGGAESLFLACGASFTRAALDVLKDRVNVRGAGCPPAPASRSSAR
jgi:hypothetical protein